MTPYRYTFSKEERLCSRKIIEDIFQRRDTRTAHFFPLMAIWRFQPLPSSSPAQVLLSVSKKKFRKAHDRNHLRRQMRELYRLQKKNLYDFLLSQRLQCAVVIVYIAPEKRPFKELQHATEGIVKKIMEATE